MVKKGLFFLSVFFLIILSLNFHIVSAISLAVEQETVKETIIKEIGSPVVFNLKITNNGASDSFRIYSLVFPITPSEEIPIASGETKTIRINVLPAESFIREKNGYITSEYFIKGNLGTDVYQGRILIKIDKFEDAFEIGTEKINPDSTIAKVYIFNNENNQVENIILTFNSVIFNFQKTVSLKPFEKDETEIEINLEKLKRLLAGPYIMTAKATLEGVTETIKGTYIITEKEGVSATTQKSGWIIRKEVIEKTNTGSVPVVVQISSTKNIISRLFSTFNPAPSNVKRENVRVYYYWEKEINPAESLKVTIITNWIFPFLLIIAIIVIVFLVHLYTSTDLILQKRISFVRAKGEKRAEFALKVIINVKAKKFMEKVRVYDRIPMIAKLHEQFATPPTKMDERTGSLRWDIENLDKGEQRVFSYLIYSKIGVIGRFELPAATGLYERGGKTHQAKSNKVFFVNEPREYQSE